MKTQINLDNFCNLLETQYVTLFANDPNYAYAAKRTIPSELARKMTLGLDSGSASKDGVGIKNVCKQLGIKHTHKAIRAYLTTQ